MTNKELFTELTDTEFKVYTFIQQWRGSGKKNMVPDDLYMQSSLKKSRATIFRALSGLRSKGVI